MVPPMKLLPAPGNKGWEGSPGLAAIGRVARLLLSAPPVGNADDKARIRRGIIERPARSKCAVNRTIARGIGIGIADVEEWRDPRKRQPDGRRAAR